MKHFATPEFWHYYRQLPAEVRRLADQKFELLKADLRHSSIRLKKIGPFWSAWIGLHYRALAKERLDGLVWFWIGSHSAYDKFKRTHP
ncbi:MAG: hypothetical protein DMF09_13195 [Verrucomicrobia bacterium]|nr:MAG: hypothetical protein DMF09_13195 [Verrucomicrobiota bacterium]